MSEPDILITRSTAHLTAEAVGSRVSEVVASITKTLELKCGWDASSNSVQFRADSGLANGTSGYLQIHQSAIVLAIRLPYLLRLQKAALKQKIEQVLDDHIR